MAEFPELGDHCSICQRLDFLPFICIHCNHVFCKEHRDVLVHKCPEINERPVELADVVKIKKEKCSFCNAKVMSDLEGSDCTKCSKYHCLGHRHPESHDCCKLKEERLRSIFKVRRESKDISSLAPKGLKGSKNDGLAKKVAFMKMKQSATLFTSVPESERTYFKVVTSCSDNDSRKEGVFVFSKMWSTGRCVDFLADHFKLRNRNNLNKSKKLVLSSINQENYLELDLTIQNAIEKGFISDGEELILELADPQ